MQEILKSNRNEEDDRKDDAASDFNQGFNFTTREFLKIVEG